MDSSRVAMALSQPPFRTGKFKRFCFPDDKGHDYHGDIGPRDAAHIQGLLKRTRAAVSELQSERVESREILFVSRACKAHSYRHCTSQAQTLGVVAEFPLSAGIK